MNSPEQVESEAGEESGLDDRLEQLLSVAGELCVQCEQLSYIEGMYKMKKRCQAELKFLQNLKSRKVMLKESHLQSSNLRHLDGILEAARDIPHIQQVLQPFHHPDHTQPLIVDLVGNHGYLWVKVIARKAQALHLVWTGGGRFGEKSVVDQASQYKDYAAQNMHNYSVPQVLFIFHNRVTPPVKDALIAVDVQIKGDLEVVELAPDVLASHSSSSAHSPACDMFDFCDYGSFSDDQLPTASDFLKKQQQKDRTTLNSDWQDRELASFCHKTQTTTDKDGNTRLQLNNEAEKDTKTEREISDYGHRKHNNKLFGEREPCYDRSPKLNVMPVISSTKKEHDSQASSIIESRTLDKTQTQVATFVKGQLPNTAISAQETLSCQEPELSLKLSGVSINEKCSTQYKSRSTGKESVLGERRLGGDAKSVNIEHFTQAETTATPDIVSGINSKDSDFIISCHSADSPRISTDVFMADVHVSKESESFCMICVNKNSYRKGPDEDVEKFHAEKIFIKTESDKIAEIPQYSSCPKSRLCNNSQNKKELKLIKKFGTDADFAVPGGDCAGLMLRSPVINRVNLDITTLISLVSNVCHGGCHFVFKEEILNTQSAEERREPLMPRLNRFMMDKEAYACESAVKDFQTILHTVGGPSECQRAESLLDQIHIVPDNPSERAILLSTSAKVKQRGKVIFGTGDRLKAITMTANHGFTRAATNQGVTFSVFIHKSRALTEQKEASAKPFNPEAGLAKPL